MLNLTFAKVTESDETRKTYLISQEFVSLVDEIKGIFRAKPFDLI